MRIKHLCIAATLFTLSSICINAATITVTNTNDAGTGSLRRAIADAVSGDTITFSVTGTIILTSGQLVVDKNLKIKGPGASELSVSGNHRSRVFYFHESVSATLAGITIENGNLTEENGAGIYNVGTLTVSNSYVNSNQIRCFLNGCFNAGSGGGIYNGGMLTLTNSGLEDNGTFVECDIFQFCGGGSGGGIYNVGSLIVSNSYVMGGRVEQCVQYGGNCDGAYGGGIFNNGSLTINSSNISYNTTINYNGLSGSGGGIFTSGKMTVTGSSFLGNTGEGVYGDGELTVNNSTVSGNNGDGIYFHNGTVPTGTVTVTNSTITGNTLGISLSGPVRGTLDNTIVASNSLADISGVDVASASHNLIGNESSSGGIVNGVNGNIVGFQPLLGPLRNNGGPTRTHALLIGSPAINAGNNALATGSTDQRGAGFARIVSDTVDIGAFELQATRTR